MSRTTATKVTRAERRVERLNDEVARIKVRLRAISDLSDEMGDVFSAGQIVAAAAALEEIYISPERERQN